MTPRRLLSLFLLTATSTSAFAASNKGSVRQSIESKWESVAWGDEIDEEEYLACIGTLAFGGQGCFAVLDQAVTSLGTDLVLEAIKKPGRVLKVNGRDIVAGIASYENYWWTKGICPTIKNPTRGCEWKTNGANSHQLYIAWGRKSAPGVSFSNFQTISGQTGTALHETGGNTQFMYASNGDLVTVIKNQTGSQSTEIHILSAAHNYQAFALQTGTALHETGDDFEFLLAPNRDIFAIKKNQTGSGTTEIHVLSAATNYQTFSLNTATSLHQTGEDFQFLLSGNRDVYAVKKSATGSNSTEVHVLSAASNYQSFSVQTRTALHETGEDFEFVMGPGNDIYAIKKNNTGSTSTEVHILSASQGYQAFKFQTGTALHETHNDFQFLSDGSGNLVAIKKSGTASRTTEIHRLER